MDRVGDPEAFAGTSGKLWENASMQRHRESITTRPQSRPSHRVNLSSLTAVRGEKHQVAVLARLARQRRCRRRYAPCNLTTIEQAQGEADERGSEGEES